MRKLFLYVLLFLTAVIFINAQEEEFMVSDIKTKLKFLSSVSPEDSSFDLYKKAAEFVLLNSGFYKNDPFFDEIYFRSSSGLLKILNSSPKMRKKTSDTEIISLLEYIKENTDETVLPHIYRMRNLPYQPEIRKMADNIFSSYKGPLFPVAADIIENNPVADKLEIFKKALNSKDLTFMEKGELSSIAMKAAFDYEVIDHKEIETVKNILITAVDVIYDLDWSEASSLVLKYFDRLIAYENKEVIKEPLVKTIKTLGKLGTHEAAVRLSMYIGLINSFAEKGLYYDEDILNEVIVSLGMIGDLVAYENLSIMENYGYRENIISASKQALSELTISR